jgi:hypothetical protein
LGAPASAGFPDWTFFVAAATTGPRSASSLHNSRTIMMAIGVQGEA